MYEISIIVPVYNVDRYLERCLDSIIEQSFKDYEIILVNDGSKDSSGEICNIYANKFNNIKVIHKENQGLGYARNSGLDIATGKYVMFVDSDDYLEKEFIGNLYKDLRNNNADTCIGGCKRISNNKINKIQNKFADQIFEDSAIISEVLVRMTGALANGEDHIMMSVWRVLFLNEIIQKNKLRFPSEREYISEDIIFDIKYYSLAKRVYMSNECGYCYCDNEGTLTTKYREDRFNLHKILYVKLCDLTKEIGIYDKCKNRIMNTFISNARYCIKLEVKFSNINSYKKMKDNIFTICNDVQLQTALMEYDDSMSSIPTRIVNKLIEKKLYSMLMISMEIKKLLNI